MYLTRLPLNLHSRDVQRVLRDSHALHRTVMSCFPSDAGPCPRQQFGVLHRVEHRENHRAAEILVQSVVPPSIDRIPSTLLNGVAETTHLGPLLDKLTAGARFRFRLRANPTRKIMTKSSPEGARCNGKRVPVRGDAERLMWLSRKLSASGMRVVENDFGTWLLQVPDGRQYGRRRAENPTTHDAYVFEGLLEVVDPEMARQGVLSGIGPGKAFGFGLLSLAPIGRDG